MIFPAQAEACISPESTVGRNGSAVCAPGNAAQPREYWPGTDIPKSTGNAFTFDVVVIDGKPCSERFCEDQRFRTTEWVAYQTNNKALRDRALTWPEFRALLERRKTQPARLFRATEVHA